MSLGGELISFCWAASASARIVNERAGSECVSRRGCFRSFRRRAKVPAGGRVHISSFKVVSGHVGELTSRPIRSATAVSPRQTASVCANGSFAVKNSGRRTAASIFRRTQIVALMHPRELPGRSSPRKNCAGGIPRNSDGHNAVIDCSGVSDS